MGLFSKKEPLCCDVCGCKIEYDKYKAKDGIICGQCFEDAGYKFGQVVFGTSIQHLKALVNERKNGNLFSAYSPLGASYIQGINIAQPNTPASIYFENGDVVCRLIANINGKLEAKKFRISTVKILSIEVLNQQTIKEKNKSVVARGIAGGLLFGPAGMLLGGMSGIGTNKKTIITNILTISYLDNDNEIQNIIFNCINNRLNNYAEFINEFNEKYKKTDFVLNDEGDIIL